MEEKNLVTEANTQGCKDLICPICHKQKRVFIPISNSWYDVECLCDFRKRLAKKRLEDISDDISFKNTDLDRDKSFGLAYNRAIKYVNNWEECFKNGYGIYFVGECGCGKTHLAKCMYRALLEKGQYCIFTSFREILQEIRYSRGELYSEKLSKIVNVPFLFIDDFGTEKVVYNGEDSYNQEKIFQIIDKRVNLNKPIIFTSNLSFQELIEVNGLWERTVDRIVGSTTKIEIKGGSYRIKEKNIPF